jgi:hypothetical protein
MRVSAGVFVLLLLAAPGAGQAQGPGHGLGAGVLLSSGAGLSSAGVHGTAGLTVVRFGPAASLAVGGYAGRTTATGSPFACVQVEQRFCTGRSDRNVHAGAYVAPAIVLTARDRLRSYASGGLAFAHRRTRSTESQAPTAICFIDGELVPCPDNPPFALFESRDARWGIGFMGAAGLDMPIAGLRWFFEIGLQEVLEEGGQRATALFLTVGPRW